MTVEKETPRSLSLTIDPSDERDLAIIEGIERIADLEHRSKSSQAKMFILDGIRQYDQSQVETN